jgi:hypothetical protein
VGLISDGVSFGGEGGEGGRLTVYRGAAHDEVVVSLFTADITCFVESVCVEGVGCCFGVE